MDISITKILDDHIDVVKKISNIRNNIEKSGNSLINALKNGNKILIAGNGGSAGDAQHFSAELTGRFLKERQSLAAVALTTDSSAITAIANDYGYEYIFSRQISGLASINDIFVGISTSGNSKSINNAFKYCNDNNIKTIGLLGRDGGKSLDLVDEHIVIPSDITANIQECHILMIHIWCTMIDEAFN